MNKFLTLLKFQLCLLLFKQGKPTTCIIEFHKPHLYLCIISKIILSFMIIILKCFLFVLNRLNTTYPVNTTYVFNSH